jgi:hypothetical protein
MKNVKKKQQCTVWLLLHYLSFDTVEDLYNGKSKVPDEGSIIHKKMKIQKDETTLKITIKVITKLPNSEQSYKGKVKTHNYINRQNQSTTGKLWKP